MSINSNILAKQPTTLRFPLPRGCVYGHKSYMHKGRVLENVINCTAER